MNTHKAVSLVAPLIFISVNFHAFAASPFRGLGPLGTILVLDTRDIRRMDCAARTSLIVIRAPYGDRN
jgi:hypothetical protein